MDYVAREGPSDENGEEKTRKGGGHYGRPFPDARRNDKIKKQRKA